MNFHGFGGLNVPADEYLNAMMNRFAGFLCVWKFALVFLCVEGCVGFFFPCARR